MHLLYARFIHKFLNKRGFIPKHKEPFKELIVQGLVKGKTYKLK
jgi:leucyl-tRNA synthetase